MIIAIGLGVSPISIDDSVISFNIGHFVSIVAFRPLKEVNGYFLPYTFNHRTCVSAGGRFVPEDTCRPVPIIYMVKGFTNTKVAGTWPNIGTKVVIHLLYSSMSVSAE